MNKVTQAIVLNEVNKMKEEIRLLKSKKLYSHNLLIQGSSYEAYLTVYTHSNEPFTITSLKTYIEAHGNKPNQYVPLVYMMTTGSAYSSGVVTFRYLSYNTSSGVLSIGGYTTASGSPTVGQDVVSVDDKVVEVE